MAVTGIIFSNIHDNNIPELTRLRTIASVPFGCRYRFIDFTLSHMVNANIFNIDVITQSNYQSLMDHLGSGKDWDLARRSGGIKILPPNIMAGDTTRQTSYTTRLEALKSVYNSISKIKDEYVVMSDCDVICNVNFKAIIEDHIKNKADITMAVKTMNLTEGQATANVLFASDESGRITDVLPYPKNFTGEADVALNIVVMRTDYLLHMVQDAIAHDYNSMTRDFINRYKDTKNFRVYKYDGYFACVSSLADYFRCSMEQITDDNARKSLFNVPNRPVYTKVRNSTPTYYSETSNVKNSMIADGCVIEGTVENSILFRGVKIGRNCTVKNCILMQDTITGENVFLNYVIADKNVVIRDGRMLSGCDVQPYYIEKGKMI
ncbi:MAG: glucose-1-phosphate adenylyltransferase subunit GlgD [Clostridia bacterium]|nr:glucose-1-phosphate adenylyltransferase subunit GlgD [Clostridia bacterium]